MDLSKNKLNRKEFFKNIQKMVADVSKKITQNSKIICFSEEYLSNLMWAHYANYHQGFLLMYDKNDLRKALVFDSKNEKIVKKLLIPMKCMILVNLCMVIYHNDITRIF